MRAWIVLGLIFSVGCPVVAHAATVEIKLNTGETVTGEFVKEDDDAVVVRLTTENSKGAKMSADMTYKRTLIKAMRDVKSAEEQYAERVKVLANTAEAHADLAHWCFYGSLKIRAVEQALLAVDLDKGISTAIDILRMSGYVSVDGKWVKESDHLAKQGLEKVRGQVMTAEDAEKQKKLDKLQILRSSSQEVVKEIEGRQRKVREILAENEQKNSNLRASYEKARGYIKENGSRLGTLSDRIRTAKANYEAASAQRVREENVYGNGRALPGTYQAERASLDAMKAEELAYNSLLENLNKAKAVTDSIVPQGKKVNAEIDDNKAALTAIESKLSTARSELATINEQIDSLQGKAAPKAPEKSTNQANIKIDDLKSSVVQIVAFSGDKPISTGTGFFTSKSGTLITNRHVVVGGDSLRFVALWDATIKHAPVWFKVVRISASRDLAALEPTTPGGTYLPLSIGESFQLGRAVIAVGFPISTTVTAELGTSLTDIVVTKGTISSIRRKDDEPEWIQHDCRIASGSSGGPIIDLTTGSVVGVNTLAFNPNQSKESIGDNLNMAIPAKFLAEINR